MTPSPSLPARRPRVFYGWYIVAACAFQTMFLATTVFSYGIFFSKIKTAFGWSSTATSAVFSFQRVQGGFAQPIAGVLVDRLGSRTMVLIGMALLGTGFILLSRIQSLWQFYAAVLVAALGMSLGFATVVNATLVNWFRRRRSFALGLVYSGTALAGFTVGLVGFLVVKFGWRDAAMMLGLSAWVVGIIVALVIRHRPEPYGYQPDGDPADVPGAAQAAPLRVPAGLTVKEALRSRAFWVLSIGTGMEGMVTNAITIHQVKHLEGSGLTTGEAATVVSAVALAFFLGRLPFALVGDRFDKRPLLMGVSLLSAMGIASYAFAGHVWPIGLFVLFNGIAHGAIVPLRPAAMADFLGTRSFASIAGLSDLPSILGGVAGPIFMGLVYDQQGDYRIALFTFAGLLACTAPLYLLLGRARFGQAAPRS